GVWTSKSRSASRFIISVAETVETPRRSAIREMATCSSPPSSSKIVLMYISVLSESPMMPPLIAACNGYAVSHYNTRGESPHGWMRGVPPWGEIEWRVEYGQD